MILPPHRRGDLTNSQWFRLKRLLPPQQQTVGRPSKDHRTTINGILWILRTGAPWRDLPPTYGFWETVSGRFYRWRKQGVWQRILHTLQQEADAAGQVNWEFHCVDSSVIRAHQHAAGAKGGMRAPKHWDGPKVGLAPKSICAVMAMGYRSLFY